MFLSEGQKVVPTYDVNKIRNGKLMFFVHVH